MENNFKDGRPLVSVIIPTKNRERELKRAIESVLDQSYLNFEIIIVDNSDTNYKSTINLFFDVWRYDKSKVRYFYNNELNVVSARNFGIRQSKGQYIAFLDDDDVWLSDKIEKQLKEFEENTNLVVCWVDDRRFGKGYVVKYPNKLYIKDVLKRFNLASTSAYMFRAKFLKEQMFDESFPSAQEYELAIRSVVSFPVKCVQEVLAVQNRSEYQITRDWKKKKLGLKLLLNKYKYLYPINNIWGYRIKFFGLQCLYSFAYLVGDRIYKIIIPLKRGLR